MLFRGGGAALGGFWLRTEIRVAERVSKEVEPFKQKGRFG
jgi:hypothetical protein